MIIRRNQKPADAFALTPVEKVFARMMRETLRTRPDWCFSSDSREWSAGEVKIKHATSGEVLTMPSITAALRYLGKPMGYEELRSGKTIKGWQLIEGK